MAIDKKIKVSPTLTDMLDEVFFLTPYHECIPQ